MPQRIGVVDDFRDILTPIRESLEGEGYVVDTATSAQEAKKLAVHPDLWIIDLRLKDKSDDKDFSGITLAAELSPEVPKIILTSFPSVQAVRNALGPGARGIPPAVGFVSKQEGMAALLRRVDLALARQNLPLLRAFHAAAMHTLPDRLAELGPEQASRQVRDFIDSQRKALTQQQELESRRASEYHRFSLLASSAGFVAIMAAVVLSLIGKTSPATVTMLGGLVINLVSGLFSYSADKAHHRLKEFLPQIQELLQLANLLELCNTFEDPSARDHNRQAVFDSFLDRLHKQRSEKNEKK